MRSFAMFTKDVTGEMKSGRRYAVGVPEVIPTGEDRQARAERHRKAVAMFELVCAAAMANRNTTPRKAPACDSVSAPLRREPMDRLDRAIASMERRIPDAPNAGPTVSEMMQQYNRAYTANMDRICAESQAAYAARNPHTKENAL